MAARAGVDPVEFRLRHLAADAPVRRCLEVAARLFGYQPAKPPSRRGYGVALGTDAGTWVAHLAEVAVDRQTGKVQVKRVVCAQDMGRAINPEGARMQMEGASPWAWATPWVRGPLPGRRGAHAQLRRNAPAPLLRPAAHRNPPGEPHRGSATRRREPAIICMGAVIANAIFDATGARLYHLPMTPERVLEALSKRKHERATAGRATPSSAEAGPAGPGTTHDRRRTAPGHRLHRAGGGRSRRMGQPKQLLPFDGRTVLACVVDAVWKAAVGRVVVVLGHQAGDWRQPGPPTGAAGGEPRLPRRDALLGAGGARRAPLLPDEGRAGFLFCLGDQPRLRADTVRRVVRRSANRREASWCRCMAGAAVIRRSTAPPTRRDPRPAAGGRPAGAAPPPGECRGAAPRCAGGSSTS